ncbi:hypothetical protein ACKI2N_032795 [Cupriavidus sp. 30B13]|uniref:hypothetical protein n=1 Tax=Cupriavidus sp. 30B13 TaxID=3384241 RepID=UPI003B918956
MAIHPADADMLMTAIGFPVTIVATSFEGNLQSQPQCARLCFDAIAQSWPAKGG